MPGHCLEHTFACGEAVTGLRNLCVRVTNGRELYDVLGHSLTFRRLEYVRWLGRVLARRLRGHISLEHVSLRLQLPFGVSLTLTTVACCTAAVGAILPVGRPGVRKLNPYPEVLRAERLNKPSRASWLSGLSFPHYFRTHLTSQRSAIKIRAFILYVAVFSASCRNRHITLPLPLLGSVSTNCTTRGTL